MIGVGRAVRTIVAVALITGGIDSPAAQKDLPEEIRATFNTSRSEYFHPTEDADLVRFEHLFGVVLGLPADLSSLKAQFDELGFDLWCGAEDWLVIAEKPDQRRGRGLFIINRHPEVELFVQAPHRRDDRSTGQLALDLLAAGAAVAGISTVPREKVDLTHTASSELNAATASFAARRPHGRVVQIHGMASKAHPALDGFEGVISNATRRHTAAIEGLRACLLERIGINLALYPEETSELGGEKNSQARVARRHDVEFRHLEFNEAARATLRSEAALHEKLILCLAENAP